LRVKSHKPSNHGRNERVADLIHQELAVLMRRELKDPRMQGLLVTEVEVTPDLSWAKVYVSHPKNQAGFKVAEPALTKAAGFLRSQIAQVLNTYSVPQLRFLYDRSVEQSAHLSSLISKALAEDAQHPQDASEENPPPA
jgi:ribosome-binding factor A